MTRFSDMNPIINPVINLGRNLPRLFVNESLELSKILEIKDNSFHYLHHVLRKKPEDFVLLLDGKTGLWQAQITEIKKKTLILHVQNCIQSFVESPDIILYFAPIKAQRLDFLIEKATELGVRKFQPILTQFTQIRDINIEKLLRIAIEASEQCERLDIPHIEDVKPLKEAIATYPQDRFLLFADESLEAESIKQILQKMTSPKIDLLIGPEGGFSDQERAYLKSFSFVKPCHLGPRILRAETAALFGLTCIASTFY